jgi:hypothetical protein
MSLIFHLLSIITIFLVLYQISIADRLDILRRHQQDVWFHVRRGTMFLKLLSLCWMVGYSYTRGWEPWPPIIAFLAAFDIHVGFQISLMRHDLWQMRTS